MRLKTFVSALLAAAVMPVNAATVEPVDYVSTLVGSASDYALSTGNTYPAVAMPWGMNFWTPQTGKNGDGWTYSYWGNKIRGLKQTHQPSPWINDYGMFAVLPTTGTPVFDESKRASWFSHKAEKATPYYYSVYLADYDITAELAPTERACAMRFTYPQTDEALVVIDPYDSGSYIKIIPEKNMVVGYSSKNNGGVPDGFHNYFVLVFDHPFSYTATVDNGNISADNLECTSDYAGAIVGFKTTERGEKVNVSVASSFISIDQAVLNLGELGSDDFDTVKQRGRDTWNKTLGRIEVDDVNIDHLRTFYSCLYRSLLFPRAFYEFDETGKAVHYSPHTGKVCDGYLYTDTGFWDTFRSLFPLINLFYPEEAVKMQAGWVNVYRESGFLPEWSSPGHRGCMVGNNSASVVADAYLQGLRGYDIETLWEAVTRGAHSVHPTVSSTGRCGYEYYDRLGYVPYDAGINENVARTLEYAYDDWCIYQLGKALGKSEKELAPYKKSCLNYKNVFDKKSALMRGRLKNGEFQSPYNPLKWGDAFTEGNAWHYSWSVFHDPAGLMNLMGGKSRFNQMLDSVFQLPPVFDDSYYGGVIHEIREMQIMNMGNYAHGNQPIQHMIYLYGYSGEPWKSQYWIREVMDRLYSANPDGYCGDEDNGQTSAWYVFSALGFYPVCPGSNQYVIGTPYFRKVTIHRPGANDLVISAEGNSAENRYIKSMSVGGHETDRNYLTRDEITAGGEITYSMAAQPNLQRGTAAESAPYSFSGE